MESTGGDGNWIVPLETVSGVAARAYASDLAGSDEWKHEGSIQDGC